MLNTFKDVFLKKWNSKTSKIETVEYPSLPQPCAYGQACIVNNVIYLAGGQSEAGLDSAMQNFWALDLSNKSDSDRFQWQKLEPWPGDARAFNITASQHNGFDDCVDVMSGRRQGDADVDVEFLKDVWEYNLKSETWRRRADGPTCVMAGTGIGFGQSHIFVLGGTDGSLFTWWLRRHMGIGSQW